MIDTCLCIVIDNINTINEQYLGASHEVYKRVRGRRIRLGIGNQQLSWYGGYLPTRDILGLARAGRIPCLLGSTLELGINSAFMAHIGLASPSIDGTVPSDVIGPFYHERDIIQEPFTLDEGAVVPPPGPGLGVSLDPAAVQAYRIDAD